MDKSFTYKVYYEDTDAGGVVYYANYLRFLERARTEFIQQAGLTAKELYDKGIFFAVKSVIANYLKPVFYGEIIKVFVKITNVGKASFTLKYDIFIKENIVFQGETVLVCIDKNFKIKKIPEKIRNFLKRNISNV